MFDTNITRVEHAAPYPQSVTVTEKRAPTDESVKILREMEAAANKRWVESVRVADNTLNCIVFTDTSFALMQRTYRAVLTLNGKKIVVDGEVPFGIVSEQEEMEWAATTFLELIAKRIAYEALREAFSKRGKQ